MMINKRDMTGRVGWGQRFSPPRIKSLENFASLSTEQVKLQASSCIRVRASPSFESFRVIRINPDGQRHYRSRLPCQVRLELQIVSSFKGTIRTFHLDPTSLFSLTSGLTWLCFIKRSWAGPK